MITFQKTQLSNGLTLITAPMKDTQAVTAMILVGVGSRYEQKDQNGISHFLEHLFFKGSKKRPSTLKLSKELDALGARYNAFTGEEMTGFFIQLASDKFNRGWEILTDMFLNPLIAEREVERERGVILEEMNMYYDTPQAYVGELAKQVVYGDTPLGRDIIGTRQTIASISRSQIIHYRENNYTPSNTLVVIAGAKSADWEEAVGKVLGSGSQSPAARYKKADLTLKGPVFHTHNKKTDQTHLVINFRTFPVTDRRWYVLEVLANLLGGQMSSRLFIKIRERRGLAYYVRAEPQNFHDTGILSISAGLKTSNLDEAVKIIAREIKNLQTKPVGKEELTRAKDNLVGHLALSLEGSMQIADFLSQQWFYEKKIKQADEVIAEYKKVNAQDIMKLANDVLVQANIGAAAIGPLGDKEKEKIVKILN